MNRASLIKALKIAEKYDTGGYCDADEDTVYICQSFDVISEEDRVELITLGARNDPNLGFWVVEV